jgi:hypothetical protein
MGGTWEMEDETQGEPRGLLGRLKRGVVGNLLPLFMGVSIGIAGTVFTTWWQAKNPHLSYTIIDGFPFKGKDEHIAIYYVAITNDGNAQAEDVESVIEKPAGTIDKVMIQPSWLKPEYKIDHDKLYVNVKSINANKAESLVVSLVATGHLYLPERPIVVVRGKGVNGETTIKDPYASTWAFDVLPILVALGGIIWAVTAFVARVQRDVEKAQILHMMTSLNDRINAVEQNAQTTPALGKKSKKRTAPLNDAGEVPQVLPPPA